MESQITPRFTEPDFTVHNLSNETASNLIDARLDFEIYVMGEMKFEFMYFLGECFKDNFFETLSWGNFRRFQLILSNKKNWINVYFIILRNEMSADILINTFKIYEKRNFTFLLYNANDQKSEKNIEALYDSLIFERNKFYEGILNDDSIFRNLKKISSEVNNKNIKITPDFLKNDLKFLAEKDENLIYKLGFYPNMTNKKTKNIKKSDTNNSYEIQNEIFYIQDDEATDFYGLMNFILKEYFKNFKVNPTTNHLNLNTFMEVIRFNPKSENIKKKKPKKKLMYYFVKTIDWLIVIYILSSFYKFIIDHN